MANIGEEYCRYLSQYDNEFINTFIKYLMSIYYRPYIGGYGKEHSYLMELHYNGKGRL